MVVSGSKVLPRTSVRVSFWDRFIALSRMLHEKRAKLSMLALPLFVGVVGHETLRLRRQVYVSRCAEFVRARNPDSRFYGRQWGMEIDEQIEDALEFGDLILWSHDPSQYHLVTAGYMYFRRVFMIGSEWDYVGIVVPSPGSSGDNTVTGKYVWFPSLGILRYADVVSDHRTQSLAVRHIRASDGRRDSSVPQSVAKAMREHRDVRSAPGSTSKWIRFYLSQLANSFTYPVQSVSGVELLHYLSENPDRYESKPFAERFTTVSEYQSVPDRAAGFLDGSDEVLTFLQKAELFGFSELRSTLFPSVTAQHLLNCGVGSTGLFPLTRGRILAPPVFMRLDEHESLRGVVNKGIYCRYDRAFDRHLQFRLNTERALASDG